MSILQMRILKSIHDLHTSNVTLSMGPEAPWASVPRNFRGSLRCVCEASELETSQVPNSGHVSRQRLAHLPTQHYAPLTSGHPAREQACVLKTETCVLHYVQPNKQKETPMTRTIQQMPVNRHLAAERLLKLK